MSNQCKQDEIFHLSVTELLLIIMFALMVVMFLLNSTLQNNILDDNNNKKQVHSLLNDVNRISQQLGLSDGVYGESPLELTAAIAQLQFLIEQLDKVTNSNEASQVLNKMSLDEVWSTLVSLNETETNLNDILLKLKKKIKKIESENEDLNKEIPIIKKLLAKEQLINKDLKRKIPLLNKNVNDHLINNEKLMAEKLKIKNDLNGLINENKKLISAVNENSLVANDLEKKIKELNNEKASLVKNNKELIIKFKRVTGKGMVYPPCWIDDDAKIQYTFRLVVTDNKIRIENIFPLNRYDEYSLITKKIDYNKKYLTHGEFRNKMSSFLSFSKKQIPECRFYVKVKDETSRGAKAQWKRGLSSVESAFYKYLL